MRSTPIIKSLAEPLKIKGCAYELFSIAMVVALALMVAGYIVGSGLLGFLLGIVAFAGLFSLGKRITAYDPQLLTVWLAPHGRYRILDPKKFRERAIQVK
jgi:Type IV secretory pathway, VirB3-like protein